jgi:hypothetical protein
VIRRLFNPRIAANVATQPVLYGNGEGLRMSFSITRSLTSAPDVCRMSIWNLSPARVALMTELVDAASFAPPSQQLSLAVGYDETTMGLFTGDIRELQTRKSGVDQVTTVVADDGGDAFTDVPIRLTSAGLTPQNMVDVAVAAMQLAIDPSVAQILATSSPQAVSPYTAVVIGRASDLLNEVTRRIGARWWIKDKTLHMARRGQAAQVAGMAVVIKSDMLMSEIEREGPDLVRFTSMLDPNITPGGQVALSGGLSRSGPKYYRVEAASYQGDTMGAMWRATVIGRGPL